MKFAYTLEESLFAGNALAFYATMEVFIYGGGGGPECLDAGLIRVNGACDENSDKFTFIRLTDNYTPTFAFVNVKTYVIKNADGQCVTNAPGLADCDFNDVTQHWIFENINSSPTVSSDHIALSSGGSYLTMGESDGDQPLMSSSKAIGRSWWKLTVQDM